MNESTQKQQGQANAGMPTVLPIVGEESVTILDRYDKLTLAQGKLDAMLDMLDQALCSDGPPPALHSYLSVMRDQCQHAVAAASELWNAIREGDGDE